MSSNVMPFGITNAPATFQHPMECVSAGLSPCSSMFDLPRRHNCLYDSSFEDHLKHLENVLGKLGEAGLKLKPINLLSSKCS